MIHLAALAALGLLIFRFGISEWGERALGAAPVPVAELGRAALASSVGGATVAAVAFVVLLFSNEGGGAFGAFLALIAAGPLVVLGVLAGTIPLFLVGWLVRRLGRELHPALVIGVGLTFAAALAALLSAATYHARPLSLTLAILLPFTAGSLWALLSLRDETNG